MTVKNESISDGKTAKLFSGARLRRLPRKDSGEQ